LLYNRINKVQK